MAFALPTVVSLVFEFVDQAITIAFIGHWAKSKEDLAAAGLVHVMV